MRRCHGRRRYLDRVDAQLAALHEATNRIPALCRCGGWHLQDQPKTLSRTEKPPTGARSDEQGARVPTEGYAPDRAPERLTASRGDGRPAA